MKPKRFTIYDLRLTRFAPFARKSHVANRKWNYFTAVFLFVLAFSFWTSAFAQDRPTDYQVKAVFLEKFGKFVEWPEETSDKGRVASGTNENLVTRHPSPDTFPAPFIIGVFGSGPVQEVFQDALAAVASQDTIDGRRVEVRQIKALADLRDCQIIFIPASEKSHEHEILDALKNGNGGNGGHAQAPVLTVGETDDFFQAGGMIEFVIEDTQVHFRINSAAARAAGLKISSKLLTLARP